MVAFMIEKLVYQTLVIPSFETGNIFKILLKQNTESKHHCLRSSLLKKTLIILDFIVI